MEYRDLRDWIQKVDAMGEHIGYSEYGASSLSLMAAGGSPTRAGTG